MSGQDTTVQMADAKSAVDADAETGTDSAVDSDADNDDDHLADIEDGAGCTEIWEHLSDRREE
ncbi:hypothetical protein VB773_10940 [Haloarculaceae archaeon H-GB2-1]|nr:hypothetical protein [Haloarculaceae archaeon H-GB1-1]MEA5386509.1 hypothetical protein [Haloarculaceae archaeon H-GB11]MEA5408022.1 hypothetical protein [Haloarculaceae archaeon H-GB2-1]